MDDRNMSKVDMDELAKAFDPEGKTIEKTVEKSKEIEKTKNMKKFTKYRKGPIALFIVGVLALIAGTVFLVTRLTAQPAVADAEFLISAGEWVKEDEPAVIWDFTEVGRGSLTTDGHLNNYEFIWNLTDKKLKIETSWLYNLNDEFDYTIDQEAKVLTIKNEGKGVEVKFKATEKKD